MKKIVTILAAIGLFNASIAQNKKNNNKMDKEFLEKQADGVYAKIETNRGTIYAFLDHKQAPITVANFVGLAEGKIKNNKKAENVPYYNGLKFHRVIPGFMIQGGCPIGNGTGDPGYKFQDELDPNNDIGKRGYLRGVLAMANSGPNTNGSQFFIMHKDYPLPLSYNIFGNVVMGIEAVDSIASAPRGSNDLPNQDQTITSITILRKGKEAEAFDGAKLFEEEKTNAVAKREAKLKAEKEAVEKILAEKYGKTQVTASGLRYIVEKEGTGESPKANSNVTVHYHGTFLDGKVFNSSIESGEPATFDLTRVIPGWVEGIQLLKPGGKNKFIVPPALGYGENGYPGAIPPNTWLVFDLELIKINR